MSAVLTIDLAPSPQTGIEAYREYVNRLDGLHSVQSLLTKAKQMKIPEQVAKRFLESLLEKGDLNKAPPIRVNSDEFGCFTLVDGNKFYTHPLELDQAVSYSVLQGKGFEEADAKIFLDLVRPGDTALDIGANIGCWTLLLSRKAKSVTAFEPEPNNFLVLQKNIISCRMTNVKTVCAAVGNLTGYCTLYLNPRNAGDHRVWSATEKRKEVLAQCVSLDEWMDGEDAQAIKIDTQGAEFLILSGAKEFINRQKRLVMCLEFWPTGLKALGSDEANFDKLLRDLGFEVYKIQEGKTELLKPGDLKDLIDPFSFGFLNLLCLKGV